jgi:uncharacterized membrane protein YphA (DoxX/SURF4 family)
MAKPVALHDSKVADTVWLTLRLVFGLVPIVAGLDKFTNLLVDWSKYLAPFIAHMVPAHGFMMLVGIIEIIAGIGVLFTPWTRIFASIVGIWLIGIALNLLIAGFYDIAVRDAVMAVSSFCLARLTAPATERAGAMRPAEAREPVTC